MFTNVLVVHANRAHASHFYIVTPHPARGAILLVTSGAQCTVHGASFAGGGGGFFMMFEMWSRPH